MIDIATIAGAGVTSGLLLLGNRMLTKAENKRNEANNVIESRRVDSEDKSQDFTIFKDSIIELQARLGRAEADINHEREQRVLSNQWAQAMAAVLQENNMVVPPRPLGLEF